MKPNRFLPVLLLLPALGAAQPAEPRSGQAVYEAVCRNCHETGVDKAPKFGDAAAWKPLIREGQAMLSRTAIKGIRKMPPKGGDPSLSELEVRRAVAYLANAGGAKWGEPAK